jgi:hypothetical protein
MMWRRLEGGGSRSHHSRHSRHSHHHHEKKERKKLKSGKSWEIQKIGNLEKSVEIHRKFRARARIEISKL